MNKTAGYHENIIIGIDWDARIRCNKRKRRAELKKHTFQLIFAILFVCLAILGINRMISSAGAATESDLSFKYYKNICAEEGDTLFSIAETYAEEGDYDSVDAYVSEVRFMNHLEEEDTLYAGDYLIIPYYSNELK